MKINGKIVLKHYCKKWKKGMKKPELISDKKNGGLMICSLCREKVGGKVVFN